MKMVAARETVILLLLFYLNSVWLGVVKVSPGCRIQGDCVDISSALSNLLNGTTVVLLEGDYLIDKSLLVENVYNISIVGIGSNVVLSCSEGSGGITFVRVNELVIRNVTMKFCNVNDPNIIPLQGITRLSYSILIASCSNIVIENALLMGSSGIGLVVISVMETFSVSEVNFTGNVGGGLLLMSFDPMSQNNTPKSALVNISSCWFLNNTSSALPRTAGYESMSSTGGGLTFSFAQNTYNVQVSITDSHFVGNIGKYGGGVRVDMFSGIADSSVHFSECSFRYNSAAVGGGGLFLLTEVSSEHICSCSSSSSFEVTLSNSSFLGNQADDGGAIGVLSLQSTSAFVGLYSVIIENNSALKASAVSIQQELNEDIKHTLEAIFYNCTIQDNISPDFPAISAGAVVIQGAWVRLDCQNSVLGTVGSAIMIRSGGQLHVNGTTLIADNYGVNGGALHISGMSQLLLYNNSRLDLVSNVAMLSGGAIYVQDCTNSGCCFIIPVETTFQSCKFTRNFNTTINFHGNKAHKGASIFGSTLRSCSWILDGSWYPNFYTSCSGKHFMVFDNRNNQFETPGKLRVNTSTNAKPGSIIGVPIESTDEFDQSVEDVLTYRIINSTSNITYESALVISQTNPYAYINVYGAQNESIDIEILSSQSLNSVHINVYLDNCGVGYWYDASSKSCQCIQKFRKIGVSCTLTRLETPNNVWLGKGWLASGAIIWGYCPRGYCKAGNNNIVDSKFDAQFDAQCIVTRSGTLCSKCLDNLSVVLGSSRACKDCSNNSIALIVGVLLFGIVTIIGITLCRVDISQGYVTTIIFYCNVLSVCADNFIPIDWRIIFVGVDLLSLKLNLNACFYDGMTDLGATMVHYAFIGYMLLLVCVVCLAVSKVTMPRSHANIPAKVVPTVVLLCQVALMELCVSSLSYVSVHTLDNAVVQYRWLVSPDLAYIKSLHALPFSVAIVSILVLLLPFTMVLSYPPCTYRIALLAKLKPVYDAIWAPFKAKRHWWFIFRLLLRWIIYICAVSLHLEDSNFALGLIFMALLFLQVRLKPYVKEWHNTLDDSLLLILTLMALGGLYFPSIHSDTWLVYTLILTSCFYAILLAVVIVHMYKIFPIMVNDFNSLHQFIRIHVGKCCVRRHYVVMEELNDPPQVSSTEVTTAGPREGPDLNDNIIVDTAGAPVPDISTMRLLVPSELDQGTNRDRSKKLSLENEEQFYTCKGSKENDMA